MYRNHNVAVVVPAYNEEGFVGTVIETIPEYVDRIYVVDDASTDETWKEVQDAATAVNRNTGNIRVDGGFIGNRVVPIQHGKNRGVGAAIKTGYRHARDDGIDIAAVMAGDGQMDPNILERFLDPVVENGTDYSKGNRLLNWEYIGGMSRFRLFGNVLLTFLTKIASGYWRTSDPQNGYTAIRLDVFDEVDLDGLYDEYGFANDLLVKLNAHGKRVTDVHRPASYGDEESSIKYGRFIRNVSMLLLRDFLWRLNVKYLLRDFHPLALFYYAGASSVAIGLLLFVLTGFDVLAGGAGVAGAVSGVVATFFGVFFLLYAMVLDRRQNEALENQITK